MANLKPTAITASQLPNYVNEDGSAVYSIDQPFDGVLYFNPKTRLWTGEEFEWREGEDEPRIKREVPPAEALRIAATLQLMICTGIPDAPEPKGTRSCVVCEADFTEANPCCCDDGNYDDGTHEGGRCVKCCGPHVRATKGWTAK